MQTANFVHGIELSQFFVFGPAYAARNTHTLLYVPSGTTYDNVIHTSEAGAPTVSHLITVDQANHGASAFMTSC